MAKQIIFDEEVRKTFEATVEIPRIKVGKKQSIETLINEEALLLAKFLRQEIDKWTPRITKRCINFGTS